MVLAGLWMLAFRRGMAETLAISAAVGIAVGQLGPQ
jgi:hypothetical protein